MKIRMSHVCLMVDLWFEIIVMSVISLKKEVGGLFSSFRLRIPHSKSFTIKSSSLTYKKKKNRNRENKY